MIDEKKLIEELKQSGMIADNDYGNAMVDMINSQPKIGEWIPCSERLPEEHDSMFAESKGTDKWNEAMFEKISDDVNVTVEYGSGKRKTMTLHTVDGKWKTDRIVKFKVIAWQPLPEPYRIQDDCEKRKETFSGSRP